jgi:UDP-glucose 4-epimerase
MYKQSFLITGGCGFIGTSLIVQLLQVNPGISIRVIDNFTTGTPKDLARIAYYSQHTSQDCQDKQGVVLIEGDVRDAKTVKQCSEGVDHIVHLAANTGVAPSVDNPRLDMECNVMGTLNMLEAARLNGVKKFIFASSGAPAGEVEPPIHEELPPHPVSPYGASKLAGEGYCSAYYRTFGIDTVCLRFGNVYGPGSKKKSSVVAKFIRQALKGETCVIYGDGKQTRDFLYIDDLVRAVMLCMEKDVGGEIFQIASGMERTVGEVADLLADALARRGVKMHIEHGSPRIGDVKRNFSDTSKAARMLGWQVKTELEDGIAKTIDYFMQA